MRGRIVSFLSLVVPLTSTSACLDTGLCDVTNCTGGAGGAPTTTTSTQGGNGMGGQGGSTTTGLPDECIPGALMAGQGIAQNCGLFVEPGAAGGTGTQASPYGTLAEALAASANGGAIYVCATAGVLDEEAVLTEPLSIFGALDCATWTPVVPKTAWTASENTVPLNVISTASNTLIAGFAITALAGNGFDATTGQGNSSVAAVISGATVTLEDVDLIADAGAAGAAGTSATGQAPGRQSDAVEFDGNVGGGCGLAAGADQVATCGAFQSTGGKGGNGGMGSGSGGDVGLPNPALGEPDGSPGAGDNGVVGWSCGSNGGNGDGGHDGPMGPVGLGGTVAGTLSADAPQYVGTPGGAGLPGTVGQGGGGGGGRKGNNFNGCGVGITGPSGGSGGAGGCGGAFGEGGGAGGASMALVSLAATLTLTNVTLTASDGGAGGQGGNGQSGGQGGNGANGGGGFGCSGGAGGFGGSGGPGGGGAGGPSVGLAYTGTEPTIADSVITIAGTASTGGTGGSGGLAGVAGELAKKRAF